MQCIVYKLMVVARPIRWLPIGQQDTKFEADELISRTFLRRKKCLMKIYSF